jgi:Flp pilus assembly protein TadD
MDDAALPSASDGPEALQRQAAALLAAGEAHQALRLVVQGLARFPDDARLGNLAGECAAALGDTVQAEAHWRRVLAAAPHSARAHYNLGLLYTQDQRPAEAEQCFRRSLKLAPDNAAAHGRLGVLLAAEQRTAEAEQCYRRALALNPGNAALHCNLGVVLAAQQRHDETEWHYRRTVALDPGGIKGLTNLGNELARTGRHAEAERFLNQAVVLAPGDAMTHFNLAVLMEDLDRDGEAERDYRRALALDPRAAIAQLNLAYLLLRHGRFQEAWPLHEIRHSPAMPLPQRFRQPAPFAFPQWQGQSLQGKSLLVWPEQGLGDEVQFCRYLPLLRQRGAARLTLICKTPLKALMETVNGVDAVITLDAGGVVAPHDYWVYPLSLPLYFQTTLATLPADLPYMRVPPERALRWRERLPRDGLRVGLVWKGNARHLNDARRSLELRQLAPLWSVPGVRFISLQKERDEAQALQPPPGQPLLALGHEFSDLADTAAVIDQLDLVITVDTAVAHLAGALARPCWVLLPHRRCDWRWLKGRDDSPWYPGVMRLFRQPRGSDWVPVIKQVEDALRALAGAHLRDENNR